MKINLVLFLFTALIFTACAKKDNISIDQNENLATTEKVTTQVDLKTDRKDMELIDVNLFWDMTEEEIVKKRDEIYNGKTLEELLPNEKHNALLLDYKINRNKLIDNEVKKNSIKNYEEFPFDKIVLYDLNSDGKKEEIIVTKLLLEDGYYDGVKLSINGLEVEYRLFSNLVDSFAIVDLDKNDKYKEIIISDFGPSNDYYSVFYYYDGEKIVFMNKGCNDNRPMPEEFKKMMIEISESSDQNDNFLDEIGNLYDRMEFLGDGNLITYQRASLLQTWWYPIKYKLTKDHLLTVEPELFEVDYSVFLLKEIPLFKEMNENSQTFILEKDIVVRFTALDDIEWVEVTLPDNQKGWFKINENNTILINNEEFRAEEIFYELNFSD